LIGAHPSAYVDEPQDLDVPARENRHTLCSDDPKGSVRANLQIREGEDRQPWLQLEADTPTKTLSSASQRFSVHGDRAQVGVKDRETGDHNLAGNSLEQSRIDSVGGDELGAAILLRDSGILLEGLRVEAEASAPEQSHGRCGERDTEIGW